MITFNDLIDNCESEVKITDIIKHSELLWCEIKPTEYIKTDKDGKSYEHVLNDAHMVWEWLQIIADIAAEVNGYCEDDYQELIESNWEEV